MKKKVIFEMEEEDYQKLKAKLAMRGIYQLAHWFRDTIKKFLKEK